MPNVLSELIWVQTDCVNAISRRTVAHKLDASYADNKNSPTIITPLAYKYNCYIVKPDIGPNCFKRISADGKMWLAGRKLKCLVVRRSDLLHADNTGAKQPRSAPLYKELYIFFKRVKSRYSSCSLQQSRHFVGQ